VLHRNAAAEKFHLEFLNGLLVETAAAEASEGDRVAWMQDKEVFNQKQFRDAFSLSGARATQLLDGYVAIGTLRRRMKGDRTYYVYRVSPPGDTRRPQELDKPALSNSELDSFSRAESEAKECPEKSGFGQSKAGTLCDFPKDLKAQTRSLWYPQKLCPLSNSSPEDQPNWTVDTKLALPPPEAVSDGLPAWVTEPVEPDDSDPIGEHDVE
jgi:hypothetical protein